MWSCQWFLPRPHGTWWRSADDDDDNDHSLDHNDHNYPFLSLAEPDEDGDSGNTDEEEEDGNKDGDDYDHSLDQISLLCSFNFAMERNTLGKGSIEKKRFLSGIARIIGGVGGGLPMPEFFGPLFRSAFLVNKKSLFLQKCQCIELLTVF